MSSPTSPDTLARILRQARGIDLVWAGLTGLYGQGFTRSYGEDPRGTMGLLWAAALNDLTDEQLRHGLARCMATGSDFPPSAPSFRGLCLDVMPLAFVQADLKRASENRHPFTRMVWSVIDAWAYTNGDDYQARETLRGAYELARAGRMAGEPLPLTPAGALSGPEKAQPVRASKPNPAKVTTRGTAIMEAFAAELHPDRARARFGDGA